VLTICLAWTGSVTSATSKIPGSKMLGAMLAFMEPTSEEDFWNNQGLGREIPGGCIRRWPSRRLGLRVAHEQAETAITERSLQRLSV